MKLTDTKHFVIKLHKKPMNIALNVGSLLSTSAFCKTAAFLVLELRVTTYRSFQWWYFQPEFNKTLYKYLSTIGQFRETDCAK
jgi:hypothetical protein